MAKKYQVTLTAEERHLAPGLDCSAGKAALRS